MGAFHLIQPASNITVYSDCDEPSLLSESLVFFGLNVAIACNQVHIYYIHHLTEMLRSCTADVSLAKVGAMFMYLISLESVPLICELVRLYLQKR